MLQNAMAGDDLYIETKSIPAVFHREEEPSIIRIYTSLYEIPYYFTRQYTVAQRPLTYMWKACELMQEALEGPIVLALDYDSDNYLLQNKMWDIGRRNVGFNTD